MNDNKEFFNKQQYCPVCFRPMTQDKDDPYKWYCDTEHTTGYGAWINLTPKQTNV